MKFTRVDRDHAVGELERLAEDIEEVSRKPREAFGALELAAVGRNYDLAMNDVERQLGNAALAVKLVIVRLEREDVE